MFSRVVLALLAFIVVAFIVMWVIGGGPRRTIDRITSIDVIPESANNDVGFRLPWQPTELFPTINLPGALLIEDTAQSPQDQVAQIEAEYERINRQAAELRTFGTPSPYSGTVSIVEDVSGVRADNPTEEYVQIRNEFNSKQSVDITGWRLESALSGTIASLPAAASPFLMGSTNTLGPVILESGAIAIVASAPSPVGVSFKENSCTGYLAQFQQFAIPLHLACPSPGSILPLNEENLRRYGEGCFDELPFIPTCTFPQNLPDTVLPSCRAYLTETLSYNGCVNREQYKTSFVHNTWRMYLFSPRELWRNSHDAIRLLDAQGKTVDVFVY